MEKAIAAASDAVDTGVKAVNTMQRTPWPSLCVLLIAALIYTIVWVQKLIAENQELLQQSIRLSEKVIENQNQKAAISDELMRAKDDEVRRLSRDLANQQNRQP